MMKPRLVLVSGPPGSGKTTLAQRLAKELGLPLLSRDAIKESLLDSLGASDRARSQQLGAASYSLLRMIVSAMLDAGVGAVMKSNFRRGSSERDLDALLPKAEARLVHCHLPPERVTERYFERFARGERHPGHYDGIALHDLAEHLKAGYYEPLELAIPLLRVETSNGYVPGFETIADFARSSR